ncbi:amidase [Pendulispora brunnea]|uniref:Amidase n=1 Tax=Pendulispora brunnea TaxID=2905690 RepID=A0ABZ2KBJ5_9BACT
MVDVTSLTVRELRRKIASRQLSPVEVVDAYLAKIHAQDAKYHAFTDVYEDEARQDAERALMTRGGWRGPLYGLPIVVKDLFHIAGRNTAAGSWHWRHRVSQSTAGAIADLQRSGAIVLGKTHTVELGLGTTGTNQHFGTPRNPWMDGAHYAPGGSSSGSAVAVAAGLSPWAVGTDTGGSIRIPAAWCGVVGLKPTVGRVSLDGVVPLSATLDSVGMIARTVEDVALLYRAMRRGRITPTKTAFRVGCLPECEREPVEPSVLKAYDDALGVFSDVGIPVLDVKFPKRLTYYIERNSTIAMFEAAVRYGRLAHDPEVPLDERVRGCLQAGSQMAREDYDAALWELPLLRAQFDRLFDRVDAIVTPTTQTVARPVDGVDDANPPNLFTRFVNLLGLCALALPCGFSLEGLPCSIQIICRAQNEETMLRIAAMYQRATPWHRCRPGHSQPTEARQACGSYERP